MDETKTPVLVGSAQITQREPDVLKALSPLGLLTAVTKKAGSDAAGGDATRAGRLLASLDTIAVMRTFPDTRPEWDMVGAKYSNFPRSIANRIGASPDRLYYSTPGGNTPQLIINSFCEAITRGEMTAGLLAGAEALATSFKAKKEGTKVDWGEDTGDTPDVIGQESVYAHPSERAHLVARPVHVYPMFELELARHRGRTLDQHMAEVGRLMARFTDVAADNPLAMFQVRRSAEEIVTPSDANRWVGFPYPKYLNSMVYIDQAAAVLVTSVAHARELGIDPANFVYLHGCADAHDTLFVSQRRDYHSSPAIAAVTRAALDQAGLTSKEIDTFDLYSCFPSAVEIAMDELGIAADDPRDLTITGGLPYFGGPGNNYVTHSIAEMVQRVRSKPGTFGMVTANGGYLTKHSAGIYSTTPIAEPKLRADPDRPQREVDAVDYPEIEWEPTGRGRIETFTVVHDRAGRPIQGVLIGRLEADNRRFIANTSDDPDFLEGLKTMETLGRPGSLRDTRNPEGERINLFTPD